MVTKTPTSLAELRLTKLLHLRALHEEKRRRAIEASRTMDVFAALGYVPTEKQQLFHDATENEVLYGGSLGGGKSIALVAEAIRAAVQNPGIRVGVFRRSYPELEESVLAELSTKLGYGQAVGAVWNGTSRELKFPNGSLIMFRYAESMKDATRRQGGQYQLIIIDELTLMRPDVVEFLKSRLRSGDPTIPVLGFRASANPGGPGHGAVRNRYIDPTSYGKNIIIDHDTGLTIRFVQSSMKDNPHLDEGYRARLNSLPEDLRRAFRDGDWGVFSGQMFRELSHERHVVQPIALPATWRRYQGVDWGYSAPWAVLWAAVDEDGRVWVYRELYAKQVGEADQAKRILEAESSEQPTDDGGTETVMEPIVARFADDAMWATRGDAKAISAIYAENGVHLTEAGKGAGSRVTGWQRVRSYLSEGPACSHHRALGWTTCPRIHFFPQAENLFLELRDLPHATKGDPEDADSDAPDHASDALRYLLTNLGTGPEFFIDDSPAPGDKTAPQLTAGGLYAIRPGESLYGLEDAPVGFLDDAPWRG